MTRRPTPRLTPGAVHVWIAASASRGRAKTPGRVLTQVLARYLPAGAAPRIRRGSLGRPSLREGGGLDFNVAHTDGRVLIALTQGARIGVDVERLRRVPACLALAGEVFGAGTADALARVAEPRRSARFLALWTLLEAAVKAEGADVSQSFARFRLAVLAAGEGRPAGTPDLRPIRAGRGYCAAVALSRPISSIRIFRAGGAAAGPKQEKRRR